MYDFTRNLLPPTATVRDAMRTLESCAAKIAVVVDADHKLLGVLTDGDIRRALLAGGTPGDPAAPLMNARPWTLKLGGDAAEMRDLMRRNVLRDVPILDDEGRVVGLETFNETFLDVDLPNAVVIMAGGRGVRLRPLTDSVPKPMLTVGDHPLLEIIVRGLVEQGFRRILLSVNYKADIIKDHFRDGQRFGASIRYIEENRPLGTAGALARLPEPPRDPLLVMNGDILAKVDFRRMIDFHNLGQADATIGVRDYRAEIPYGVVRIDPTGTVRDLLEKPTETHVVNAGIYVLSPAAVAGLDADTPLDMPTLLRDRMAAGHTLRAYRIEDYWIDIGRQTDFARASDDFRRIFGGRAADGAEER